MIVSKQYERRQEIEQEHRRQKQLIYEQFMDYWFKSLERPGNEAAANAELERHFSEFTKKLIVWGSDNVLKQYLTFRQSSSAAKEGDTRRMFVAFENVILAMRRDLGHKNVGMKTGDLLSLVIRDVDKVLGPSKASHDQHQ